MAPLTFLDVFLVAQRPVLKLRRRRAEVAVAMRSSGGRGDRGPDCELTVILGRGTGELLLAEEELSVAAHCKLKKKSILVGE